MRSNFIVIGLSAISLLASIQAGYCQNSTNSPPPSARKEGGVEGDPNGAIRAMGGTEATGFQQKGTVTVPPLGGHEGATPKSAPEGTAR